MFFWSFFMIWNFMFFSHFSWYEISCFLVIFHGFFGHFPWLVDVIERIWKDKLAMMPFQRDSKNMKNEIWPHFSWKHEKWGVKFHFSCFMKNKVFSLKDENLGEWKGLFISFWICMPIHMYGQYLLNSYKLFNMYGHTFNIF